MHSKKEFSEEALIEEESLDFHHSSKPGRSSQ